jgi:hypothetical protein
MTMAFKAAPSITDAVKVGDKVDFDLSPRAAMARSPRSQSSDPLSSTGKLVASPLPGGDARAGRRLAVRPVDGCDRQRPMPAAFPARSPTI